MYLEIISPESKLFSGEIDSIIVPGASGSFQVLKNHAPIVSSLKNGTVTILAKMEPDYIINSKFEIKDDKTIFFEISSGTVEMKNNNLILLAD